MDQVLADFLNDDVIKGYPFSLKNLIDLST